MKSIYKVYLPTMELLYIAYDIHFYTCKYIFVFANSHKQLIQSKNAMLAMEPMQQTKRELVKIKVNVHSNEILHIYVFTQFW